MLFDKHPLDGYSKVLKVWIDGHEYFDRDRDLSARADFANKKKALEDKMKTQPKKNEPAGQSEPTPLEIKQ